MKRIISMILIFVMTTMLMAGCGNSDNKKVELVWASLVYESQEYETVIKVFNEKLQEYLPNTTVRFEKVSADTWTNWMSSGKQVDIAWAGYIFAPLVEVEKKSYLALDDLIAEHGPNIAKEMKEYSSDYEEGNYEGKQYLIPNQQARFKQTGSLVVPAQLWQYMDVDSLLSVMNASPYLTEEQLKTVDTYLTKVYASEDYDTDVVAKYIDVENIYEVMAKRGYDFITNGMCYKAFDENPQIVSFYETDEFKLFAKYAASWYEKGYISSEVLTNNGIGSREAVLGGSVTNDWYPTSKEGYGEAKGIVYNFDTAGNISKYNILLEKENQMYNGVKVFAESATYLTIPYTSKNPERAMQLLDLLRSPEGQELYTLLCYGFEKDSELAKEYNTYHYEVTEEGLAKGVDYVMQPVSTSKYGMASWMVGNCLLTYLTSDMVPGADEYVKDFKKNVQPTLHKTKYAGFMYDSEEISIDLTNIRTVISDYEKRLFAGTKAGNWESLHKEMMDKMNASGLENVKQKLQSQADEYAK